MIIFYTYLVVLAVFALVLLLAVVLHILLIVSTLMRK